MFAGVLGAVRADIDRQVGWARGEVQRQIRHAVVVGALAGMAAVAAMGALTVGLIALHDWLAMQVGSLAAFGIIGAGLLLLALILLLVVFLLRRPRMAARPGLQIARPAAALGALGQARTAGTIAGGEDALRLATISLRDGTRSQLLGTLALITVVGLIVGRRLRRARPMGN